MPLPSTRSLVVSALLLIAGLPARADDNTPLTLQLVSEVTSIRPGQPFYVGLALHHGTGWHTYWKYPGVVGVATNMNWKNLPQGFKAEPIAWPEPEAVRMFQIKAQGYERDVVLPIKITPPADLVAGASITLAGQATYMCCNRQCHPGFQDMTITLPVKASAQPAYDEPWHAKIAKELSLQPQTSSAWTSTAIEGKEKIVLTLKPVEGSNAISGDEATKIIFFTEDGLVDTDKPQQIERLADGSLRFTLVKCGYIVGDKPTTLQGVLLHPAGWESGGKLRCMRVAARLKTSSD